MGRRRFRHLTRSDRLTIGKMLKKGFGKQQIADAIGVDNTTIYREIKRGLCVHDGTPVGCYSPDIAHEKYREALKKKGPGLKIEQDRELMEYLEGKMSEEGYSPGAALGEIERDGLKFGISISRTTLYRYVDIGVFETVTSQDLPVKPRKKKKRKKVRKKQARASAGKSIEKRPEDIDTRDEFGHWEMDTVMGKRGTSRHSLLVLTERKTRYEIIYLLTEHTTAQVVGKLDALEGEWGDRFPLVFKTVTVDNGTEFADCPGMERSALGEGSRTTVYYCHPYSSYERGSNEVANRLIRRRIPKGADFDDRTEGDIKEVEDWVNGYPREMFGYETAKMRFDREIEAIPLP